MYQYAAILYDSRSRAIGSLEELRQDPRAIMQKCRLDYEYVPPSKT